MSPAASRTALRSHAGPLVRLTSIPCIASSARIREAAVNPHHSSTIVRAAQIVSGKRVRRMVQTRSSSGRDRVAKYTATPTSTQPLGTRDSVAHVRQYGGTARSPPGSGPNRVRRVPPRDREAPGKDRGQEVWTPVTHLTTSIEKEDHGRPNHPERTQPFARIMKEIQRERHKPLLDGCRHSWIAVRRGFQPRTSLSPSLPDVGQNRFAFSLRCLKCLQKIPSPSDHRCTSSTATGDRQYAPAP